MAKQFLVTMETGSAVDHATGDRRKGLRVFRLEAADKDEARSLAEQSAREEHAQVVLAGDETAPTYKFKSVEAI